MIFFSTQVLLSIFIYHRPYLARQLDHFLGIDNYMIDVTDDYITTVTLLSNQSESYTETTWMQRLLLLLRLIISDLGGGGSSPGSPRLNIIDNITRGYITVSNFLYNFLEQSILGCEHGFFNDMLSLYKQISHICVSNYVWIVPTLYIIHKCKVFMNKKYYFTFQYRVPSHKMGYIENFHYNTQRRGIIILRDFIQTKTHVLARTFPKVDYSRYMVYNIQTFYRLQKLCDSLRLVCVNRFNLVLDTVHNTYAGAGFKCILDGIYRYSSIVVQIATAAYSQEHRRIVFTLLNILVVGGIGVVVWYKHVDYFQHPWLISEPASCFRNPTAVVAGYKKVTFWMTQDYYEIVKHTYLNEKPFNDIIKLSQFWGVWGSSMIEKDRVTYIGLAIMIATFITTGILKTG